MSNQSLSTRVQEELKQAVESGLLPDAARRRAMQLLGRLDQPVRVGLLGMPGAGKSKILNLLVGKEVIPDGVNLPTVQLIYGDTEQAICTLADEDKTTLNGIDVQEIAALEPIFVELRMPLPALKKISVMEVEASSGDPEALHRASQWAAKRCDVAMWCTKGFLPAEQNVWAQMPDMIKDHGFLMLTHADHIAAAGKLDIAMTAVRKAAGNEFNHVLSIATTDALASRKPDGSVDKDQMRASGGLALIAAVLKQVDQGRQSAVDRGDILLHQNADALAGKLEAVSKQDVTAADAGQTQDATTVTLSIVENGVVSRIETDIPVSRTADSDEIKSAVVTLHPATREAYETALQYIAKQSSEIAEIVAAAGEDAPAQVIATTVEHVQWICDYLNENGDDSDQALVRARETAFDAADLAQLMQMEKNDNAAIEALSLLLQIKYELQADLAA